MSVWHKPGNQKDPTDAGTGILKKNNETQEERDEGLTLTVVGAHRVFAMVQPNLLPAYIIVCLHATPSGPSR